MPPVPRPRNSFAIGLNYQAHADEGSMEVPDNPLVFTKFPSCLVGPTADIEIRSDGCDYEAELVVVIGEGEKDEAPMLANGELVGNGDGRPVEVQPGRNGHASVVSSAAGVGVVTVGSSPGIGSAASGSSS